MRIYDCWIYTANYDAQQAWYSERGFEVVEVGDDAFAVQAGWSRLIFRSAPNNKPQVHHFAFNISPDRLSAAHHWAQKNTKILQHEGQDIVKHSSDAWSADALYFYDAGGNIVEFIARHRLAKRETKRDFMPSELLCLSEIGLAGDPVAVLAHWASDTVGLALFTGDPEGDFCGYGDDDGVLIIVAKGRNWLPTQKAAAIHEVALTVEGDSAAICHIAGYPYKIEVLEKAHEAASRQ